MCSTRWSSGATPASAGRHGSAEELKANRPPWKGDQSWRQLKRPSGRARSRLWDQKPDDWGNPLRPANLNRGVYKGGRRPIDIFWRIAKGINGAQMPAHYPSPLNEAKVWDLVNFVLALPYEPDLLKDASAPETGTAVAAASEIVAVQPSPCCRSASHGPARSTDDCIRTSC